MDDIKQGDTVSTISANTNARNELGEKFKRSRAIAWIIFVGSFLLIAICILCMSMSWYPDETLQGCPVVISILICLCSLIIAINQSIRYSRINRIILTTSKNPIAQSELKTIQNNSSGNSIISLVCAIIPIVLYALCTINIYSSPYSNADQSPMVIVIYYWTIGFWLALVWLICGILGLKSEKRSMAIASLIIKPIGLIIFTSLMFIRPIL